MKASAPLQPGAAALEVWHGALCTQEPWAPWEQPGPEEGRANQGPLHIVAFGAGRPGGTHRAGVCATSGVLGRDGSQQFLSWDTLRVKQEEMTLKSSSCNHRSGFLWSTLYRGCSSTESMYACCRRHSRQ